MQEPLLPVLVFAQSGRFIAQSAHQAGYRVWLADCFGDQDTLAVTERWQHLAPIQQLSKDQILHTFTALTQGEACLLLYGSGIEYHYSLLDELPENIKLVGNNANTIQTIQTPTLFFGLLDKLSLSYPETRFDQAENSNWLSKSACGFGGSHIQPIHSFQYDKNSYFQRYIEGSSGSALFIANGRQAQLLSINQHYLHASEAHPFRLGGILSPWQIARKHYSHLELAVNKITAETQLKGINSLDFIISADKQLLLLEVNPRLSASAELINQDTSLLCQHHIIASCHGQLTKTGGKKTNSYSGLHYIYACKDTLIPSQINWPSICHDIPVSGTFIRHGEPICTLHASASSPTQLYQQFKQTELAIYAILYP